MRLSGDTRRIIVDAIRSRDPDARIILFGSRTDDRARGGDIDLLVVSDRLGFRDLWPIRRDILDQIGWQKLDLILREKDKADTPIARVAEQTGVCL